MNKHHLDEVLVGTDHVFLGSGAVAAQDKLPQRPQTIDYFNVLKGVIDDPAIASVGGHIQYGCFEGLNFNVYGIVELGDRAHYWRGALDLNAREFMENGSSLIPGFPYIDPFTTFGGI